MELRFPLLAWLDLGTVVDLSGVSSSDTSGYFSYGGFLGALLGLDVLASGKLAAWKDIGELRAGGGLGAGAYFACYTYTALAFFTPSVSAEGFLEYLPSFLPSSSIRLVPFVNALFRRDMDYWLQAGIGLEVDYRFGGAR